MQKFTGKEDHLELIYELRTVHAPQREEQELQKADKDLVMTLKKHRDKEIERVRHKDVFTYKISQTPTNLITPLFSPLRPLKRRRLKPEW